MRIGKGSERISIRAMVLFSGVQKVIQAVVSRVILRLAQNHLFKRRLATCQRLEGTNCIAKEILHRRKEDRMMRKQSVNSRIGRVGNVVLQADAFRSTLRLSLFALRLNAGRQAKGNGGVERKVGEVRDRQKPIKVYVSDEERRQIEEKAEACQLAPSAYLRSLGMGYKPRSGFDREAIGELGKLNADQGRLGGLLKLWLSEKKGEGASAKSVRGLLEQIEETQETIVRVMMKESRRL